MAELAWLLALSTALPAASFAEDSALPACAVAEAMALSAALEALEAVGIGGVALDITLPAMSPALLDAAGLEGPARARLARALDRKDAAEVARLAEEAGPPAIFLVGLLAAETIAVLVMVELVARGRVRRPAPALA